jgi:hypothetical protein
MVLPDTWIKSLYENKKELYSILARFNVHTDKNYLDKRSIIPIRERATTDFERFASLFNLIDFSDPFYLVQIAPYDVLQYDICKLDITVRINNAFASKEIKKVADLCKYNMVQAMRWRNFGCRSCATLNKALCNLIDVYFKSHIPFYQSLCPVVSSINTSDNDTSIAEERESATEKEDDNKNATHNDRSIISAADSISFYELLVQYISSLPSTKREVCIKRLGLNGEIQTLDQLGASLNLTRERVRQIERQCIRKLNDVVSCSDLLELHIKTLLSNKTDPLYIDEMVFADTWFLDFYSNQSALINIIKTFCKNSFHFIDINDRTILTEIVIDSWSKLETEMIGFLSEQGNMLSENDIRLLIRSTLAARKGEELANLLYECIQYKLHFERNENGEVVLQSTGNRLQNAIRRVLSESDKPLHYSEITRRCAIYLGEELDKRYIHNCLISLGFKLFNRGTYGTLAHVRIKSDEQRKILEEIESMIADYQGNKQWTCDEILYYLERHNSSYLDELDKYLINILLEKSQLLKSVGRLVWTKSDRVLAGDFNKRIDIREACIEILEAAQRPLTFDELRTSIIRKRGVSEFFMIQPTERLIRIDRNLWGLVERDIPLTSHERLSMLNILVEVLEKRNRALHSSELFEQLYGNNFIPPSSLTVNMIVGLIQTDKRFRFRKGQMICLSIWEDTGRITMKQAVEVLNQNIAGPFSTEEFRIKLEALLEIYVSKNEAARMLYLSPFFRYDSEAKLWYPLLSH